MGEERVQGTARLYGHIRRSALGQMQIPHKIHVRRISQTILYQAKRFVTKNGATKNTSQRLIEFIVSLESGSDLLRYLSTVIDAKDLSSSVHLGNRLIFLTETVFFELEHLRKVHRSRCATRIQSFWAKSSELIEIS